MKEPYTNVDDKSREASQNISIAFDENAWCKMEALLDNEDNKTNGLFIANTLRRGKNAIIDHRWLLLLLSLLLTGAGLLLAKNEMLSTGITAG